MKKRPAKRPLRRTTKRASQGFVLTYRKLTIGTLAIVAAFGLFSIYKQPDTKAVLGASVFKPMYAQATASWANASWANGYNVYYKLTTDTKYTNAVRGLPQTSTTYTIQYLKKDAQYVYRVAGVVKGKEVWITPQQPLVSYPM